MHGKGRASATVTEGAVAQATGGAGGQTQRVDREAALWCRDASGSYSCCRWFAGEKSEWGEGWRRRVQCSALGHRPVHRDRLRPIRAANPQALLSLAEDSLALNRSRVEHSTAPRPGPDCCTLAQRSLSARPAASRREPVHARHPHAAPSSARRVWRRHTVPRYALHRPAWPCRSTDTHRRLRPSLCRRPMSRC